jgi:hypothetical protein
MKIIDNFLPDYQFKQIQSIVLSDSIPWTFSNGIANDDIPRGSFQFVHYYFDDGKLFKDGPSVLAPCLKELKVGAVFSIKCNLTSRTLFHRKTGWHTDNLPCSTTAVYYINTNNGWTEFKKGGKVKSVENRMLIFDSSLEHMGVTCTDQKSRVVINFNYENN